MIVFPVLKTETSFHDQMMKIEEEFNELDNADTSTEVLEEAFDLIQATIGYISMIASKEEIEEAAALHFEKLKSRGWEFTGFIDVNIKE